MNIFLLKVKEIFPNLSKKQQMLASYLLNPMNEIAFMTSVELAKAAKVSNATVSRFANSLGYSCFHEMQKDIQRNTIKHYTSMDEVGNLEGKRDEISETMINSISTLQRIYSQRDVESIESIVDCIVQSEKVLITGYQWCESLVTYTSYELGKFKKNVHKLMGTSLASYDLIYENSENSCAIVFAMPRYPKKMIAQLKKLEESKTKIILITDELFPYANKADFLLKIPLNVAMMPTVIPLVTIMIVMQEIISRLIVKDSANAKKRVADFEKNAESIYSYYDDLV